MLHALEMFGAAVAIAFVTRANTILQIIGFLRLSLFLLLRLFRDKRRLWDHSQMMSAVRGEGLRDFSNIDWSKLLTMGMGSKIP